MIKKPVGLKTLKYPIWFEIVFACLTILAPMTLIIVEGLNAPAGIAGTTFKVSFMVLIIGIAAWVAIKKIWIKNLESKLLAKQLALEHDYSIDIGNLEKIKYLWYQNEVKLTILNLVSIVLYGGLAMILLLGVSSQLMEIKGLAMILAGIYVVAYTFKFVLLLSRSGVSDE